MKPEYAICVKHPDPRIGWTPALGCPPQYDTAPLVAALNGMVRMYVELVESGDAGFWDAEKVPEVIAARAALAKVSPQADRTEAKQP